MLNIKHFIYELLLEKGFSDTTAQYLNMLTLLLALVLIAFIVDFITKRILRRFSSGLAKRTKTNFDDILVTNKLPRNIAHIIPLFILIEFVPQVFSDFENAEKASNILFSKSFKEDIKTLDEATFLDVFEGVPQSEISRQEFNEGLDMIAALAAKTHFLNSNVEARRALKENSVSVNKEKVKEDYKIDTSDLINDKYVVINKGKRNTYIIKIV